jgi:hypothetical protein
MRLTLLECEQVDLRITGKWKEIALVTRWYGAVAAQVGMLKVHFDILLSLLSLLFKLTPLSSALNSK